MYEVNRRLSVRTFCPLVAEFLARDGQELQGHYQERATTQVYTLGLVHICTDLQP